MSDLERIRKLAQEQRNLENDLEAAQRTVDAVSKHLRQISDEELPNAMDTIGVTEVVTEDGLKVTVTDDFTASASKRNFPAVMEHLERLNATGLVKHELVVPFDKDKDAEAKELLDRLTADGFAVKDKQDINTSSLKAFVKEQLQAGTIGPSDLPTFGLFAFRRAKIKS